MMRRLPGLFVVALLLVAPLFAAAQSTNDIQARIQALLAQIEQLKTQITQLQIAGGTTICPAIAIVCPAGNHDQVGVNCSHTCVDDTSRAGGVEPKPSTSCPLLKRRLTVGARGDDVKGLQSFLVKQSLLSTGAVSGFFGPLTQHAVEQFQSDQGIVSSGDSVSTGFGAVGSATVNAINRTCRRFLGNPATTPQPSYIPGAEASTVLKASPTTGKAPLAVRFSYTLSDVPMSTAGYRIDFGDGAGGAVSIDCGSTGGYSDMCARSLVASHTYANAGTYTATLSNSPCNGNVSCMAPVELLGSVTIVVTSPSIQGTASCAFNSQTVAHGASVIAYQSSTVPSGSQCMSQTRTCSNGVLSGSYTSATCAGAVTSSGSCPAFVMGWMCPDGTHDQYGPNCSLSCVQDSTL